jgi:tetratricopeptide (TPR) repeat protein
LKEGLSKGKTSTMYDPYLTDLYSLGVTMLSLLTADAGDIDKKICSVRARYGDDYVKDLINLLIDREWPKIEASSPKNSDEFLKGFQEFQANELMERLYQDNKFLAEKRLLRLKVGDFRKFLEKKREGDPENKDAKLILNLLQLNKETSKCISCYELLHQLKPIRSKKDKELYMYGLQLRAEFAAVVGNFERAKKKFRKLMRMYMEKRREEDLFMADLHLAMSELSIKEKSYITAFKSIKTALKIQLKFHDYQSPFIHKIFERVGLLLQNQGKFEEAKRVYYKALKRYTNYYGDTHPLVALTYARLGTLAINQHNWTDAINDLQKALELHKNWFGPESAEVAGILGHVANMYRHKGDVPRALKNYKKALAIYAKIPECLEAAILCEHVGSIFREKRDNVDAKQYFEQALQIKKRTCGLINADVVSSYCLLGDLMKSIGKLDESLANFAQALDTALRLFTENDSKLGEIFFLIGETYGLLGEFSKGISKMMKAAKIYEHNPIRCRVELSKSYLYIGKFREETGKEMEAMEYYKKALAAISKAKIEENMKVERGIIMRCIARVERKLYLNSLALSNMCQALDLVKSCEKYVKEKPEEIAKMYDFIAEVNMVLGQEANSLMASQNALEFRVKKAMKKMKKKEIEHAEKILEKENIEEKGNRTC